MSETADSGSGPAASGAAYIAWVDENAGTPEQPRNVRVAWLVRDVTGWFGERREFLAYLGRRPEVTDALREEVLTLYPDLQVDWEAVRKALAGDGPAKVAALTDDELVLQLRELASTRGLSLMDLGMHLS